MNKGFTLAEILVVMAITAIVGTILVAIFTNTLRGSNKSQILAVIKQNGQAALENMDKTIRNADNVICPKIISPATSASSDTLVIVKNGLYTRFKFILATSSQNGMIQQDQPVQSTAEDNDKSNIEFFLRTICVDPMGTDSPGVVTLTDTNTQSGVSVENGLFTRDQQSGSNDSISIRFELVPGITAPEIIRGQIDPVTFQTTIGLR